MTAQYPVPEQAKINDQAEADMQWLQGLIGAVRNIRGEMGLGNARLLPVLLQNISDAEREQITVLKRCLKHWQKLKALSSWLIKNHHFFFKCCGSCICICTNERFN
jgi:valyl-tRNA synthetase